MLSVQDIQYLLDFNKRPILPIYPFEVLDYVEKISNEKSPNLTFKFLDCRIDNNEGNIKNSIKLSKFSSNEVFKFNNFFF